MVYFGTANYGFKASVQITASHNAAPYNGMKVSTTDAQAIGYDAGLKDIKAWIDEGVPTPVAEVRGKVYQKEILADYLAFMRKFKKDLSGITIAMDLSNGMSNLFAKEIFGTGGNVHYLFDTMDGRFPNHEPNPLIEANVVPLENLVREVKADAGVIYDGHADRVVFVDEKGRFISPDLLIALMGRYYVNERGLKGIVLQDIRSSKAVGEYLEPMGCQMYTWKVGRAFAAAKLREIDGEPRRLRRRFVGACRRRAQAREQATPPAHSTPPCGSRRPSRARSPNRASPRAACRPHPRKARAR